MNRFFRVTLLFLCLCGKMCFSQTTLLSNTKYQLETGTYLSTSGITPFWLRSNQYGIVPLQAPILTFRGSAHKEYDSTKNENQQLKKFGYGYGFWGVANVGKQSTLLLPEAYFKVRYGAFEFYGGCRREIMGLVDTTLTSGSYIWSGNALPMPKIQISLPNYRQIGKSPIFIKGGFSHGWFGDQGYVKNYYLHQKWFYGRIGKENAKFKFYAGFNHNVQWGGTTKSDYIKFSKDGQLAPYPWYSYQFVLVPFLQKLIEPDGNKLPIYDTELAIGNHLGSYDLGFELDKTNLKFLFYKQQPYDFARSIYRLNNIEDGLYGLSLGLKNKKILQKILLEYLFTTSQGIYRFGQYRPSNYVEFDNYFAHGQYNRWAYNNFIIGTPFILANDTRVFNNRVKAFSTYIKGQLGVNSYLLGGSFSSNLGVYGGLLDKNQFSGKLCVTLPLKNNAHLYCQSAFDIGSIYPNNVGFSIFYRKLL